MPEMHTVTDLAGKGVAVGGTAVAVAVGSGVAVAASVATASSLPGSVLLTAVSSVAVVVDGVAAATAVAATGASLSWQAASKNRINNKGEAMKKRLFTGHTSPILGFVWS